MRFRITMKSPDAVDTALHDILEDISPENREETEELITHHINRWFEYGEYLTVELDTDEGTATVIRQQ
jgi:hypothetical protein